MQNVKPLTLTFPAGLQAVLVRDGGPGQHYSIEHEAADGQAVQDSTEQQRRCRQGLVFPCLGAWGGVNGNRVAESV